MSVIGSNILAGASGQGGGYNLERSLRFRSSASAYLSRTPASASNRTTWTWSGWVKRGTLGATNIIFEAGSSGTNDTTIYFNTSNQLEFFNRISSSVTGYLVTTQVFRDPSAWYHIVAVWNSGNATASSRMSLYINGVQITSFATQTNPSLNENSSTNNTVLHKIGATGASTPSSGYLDGYMTEMNFIDGQALTPSSFGETNAQTGVWQPKRYTGTYGTNGFYLPFTDNSALTSGSNAGLGKDFSGNGNYWNTNNISITSGSTYDSMTDVPTLTSATASNFCVLNPLANPNGTIVTYSNGNLAFSHSSSAGNANKMTVQGTMAIPAGKFYWEYTVGATVNDQLGIGTMLVAGGSADGTAGARYLNDGSFQSSYTTPSSASSYTTNDVLGMAYDQPSGTLAFYKNNTLQGTVTNISTSEVFFPLRSPNTSGSGGAGVFNFGQRPFAYTPPTGFVALNTFNLPTPTIGATASTQANKYFDATIWTGDGTSSRAITNSGGFQPDFVWTKARDGGSNLSHTLYDALRGATKYLVSNDTQAEATLSTGVTAFNSNGFQIGTWPNQSSQAQVAWQWRASNASGVTNTAGSITSTVSANTSAGFSVVTYTGTGSNATVGHGLGVAPSMIIGKSRDSAEWWYVYHTSLGNTKAVFLQSTSGAATNSYWNNTSPTSSVFSIGSSAVSGMNVSGEKVVAYCFAAIAGYSAMGSYTGNGSTDGTFVFCNFRPRFIMIKRTDSSSDWWIHDTSRNTYNLAATVLRPNDSVADTTDTTNVGIDILSNGFKVRNSYAGFNASGGTYIYYAVAENPFKYSLGR